MRGDEIRRLDPLTALDQAQTACAAVIARLTAEDWSRPTPCDDWSVRDIVNKIVASTITFSHFGRRDRPDPPFDLVHPAEIVGDDPLGAFLAAAAECREVWRRPDALDGTAPSTVGEFPAKAVLNGRIFDTTILTWDLARATDNPHHISAELATYVHFVAERLVDNVRRVSPQRYKDAVATEVDAAPVERMVAVTGRDPHWTPLA